jgi:hypothetical protein
LPQVFGVRRSGFCCSERWRLFRRGKSAFPITERGGRGFSTTADVDLLPLLKGERNREVLTPLMTAVTKGEVLGFATATAEVSSGIKGDGDRHPGVGVHFTHNVSSFCF